MPEPEEEETIQPVELGRATKVVESFIDQMFTGFELDTQDKLEEYFQKVELKHNSDPTFNDHVNAVRNETPWTYVHGFFGTLMLFVVSIVWGSLFFLVDRYTCG